MSDLLHWLNDVILKTTDMTIKMSSSNCKIFNDKEKDK